MTAMLGANRRQGSSLTLGLVLFALALPAWASSFSPGRPRPAMLLGQHHAVGAVTGVADGDTLYVLVEGARTRIRLADIDAPEKRQPYGRRAEQSLRELVGKREVRLTWSRADQYGRPLARIIVDGQDVNAEQVRRGYAWVYRQHSSNPVLLRLESEARRARRGLWSDEAPVPPWDWRKTAP